MTDQGCIYTVEVSNKHNPFRDNELISNDGNAFEISFYRKCFDQEELIFDGSIATTILHILSANILSKGDTCVFFFVCDTSDGNGKNRARKFNWWFISLKQDIPQLEKYNFVIPGVDGEEFDISLLIFENHPRKKEYIRGFDNYLTKYFSKH